MSICRIAIVLAAMASGAAQAVAPMLSGTYRSDCAPYDGAAFIVTLPVAKSGREIWLRANVPLAQAPGAWVHGSDSRPGGSSLALCETRPDLVCTYPVSAIFRIEAWRGGKMRGVINARFADGATYRRQFVAAAARRDKARMCG